MSILDKLLDLASKNNSVRAVVMNGSRVNPNIESDKYQDYDIVFYVNNYQEFIKEHEKETLAQVFTDVRYKKEDNVLFSRSLLDILKKQGFMNHTWKSVFGKTFSSGMRIGS